MTITTRDPADMTGQERMQEIAAILAACIQRTIKMEQKQCTKADLGPDLTGLSPERERVCDDTKKRNEG